MQQVVDSYCIFSFVDQKNRPFGLRAKNKPEEPSLWFNIFILSFVVI